MASSISTLVKDTAWYGLSTILGRLLNWLLVPFYVRVLQTTGEYGIVTNLYAWTALLLVVLTYGMETGFFRFMNGSDTPSSVYKTSLVALLTTSSLFAIGVTLFAKPISIALLGVNESEIVAMMAFIIASDAFMSIPYAHLRFKKQSKRFAFIKLVFVGVNIGLNLFFLLLCPYLYSLEPSSVSWCYRPDFGVHYIFLSNLIANAVVLALLLPTIFDRDQVREGHFSFSLLGRMLRYSIPLVLLGIAGIFNQMADKILFPFLYTNKEEAMAQLGIYGACFKIAVVMVLFTQAFRYAFEPFFFEKTDSSNCDEEKRKKLALVTYYAGLAIIPWVMWGEMMMGIALNLSTWYKLTNHTATGAIISLVGCAVGVGLILWGVPLFGFMACAWAIAIGNTLIVVLSYILGQKHYPIPYNLSNALRGTLVAAVGYLLIAYSNAHAVGGWKWLFNLSVVVAFLVFLLYSEKPFRFALVRAAKKVVRH